MSNERRNSRPIAGILRMLPIPSIGTLFHAYAVTIPASVKILTVSLSFDAIVTTSVEKSAKSFY